MLSTKEKVLKDAGLRRYSDLINKIAKVEFRSIASTHLIDFDELVSIGLQTISILYKEDNFENLNESYLSTAIKWAIRNELRSRYKWYGVRQQKAILNEDERSDLRDAIYSAVLSTDEMCDGERSFEIKDIKNTPEENCEFSMLSTSIKSAVMSLPQRERDLIESKFFKDKKLHELSDEFSISPSRISRIIKQGLDKIKDELIKEEII